MTASCVAWYQWVPHDPDSESILWNKRDKVPWKRSLNLYVGVFVDRMCVKGIPRIDILVFLFMGIASCNGDYTCVHELYV